MSQETKHFYEFGEFRLDAGSRLLMRGGEVVPLKQKAIDTLVVLIEGRGEVLEKDALMQRLWPDTFVDEANLTQNIYVLRKLLGADWIETIPRRGYRFAGEVRESGEAASELIIRESTRARMVIQEEVSVAPKSRFLLKRVAVAAAVIAALAIASRLWTDRAARQPVASIAVLPFHSLNSGDAGDALGLGMADTLITKLSATGGIVVRPTDAVLKYAGSRRDSRNAGRELGVASVLDGSIQRQDDRLRVTVRLVRTNDGTPLWAAQFDERVADVFAMQDSIARKVTDALSLHLSEGQRSRLLRRGTSNAEAYQLYLVGRYFWNKRTEEGLKKSIGFFDRAIAADPSYALAHAGLADAYVQLPGYSPTASMEVYPKAKAAAARAVELDPSLAEAHTAAAGVLSYFEWNWRAAEAEYRTAIALDPGNAAAHQRLGVQLAAERRPAEALRELRRAQEIDPLSLINNALVGFAWFENRHYDAAIAELRKVVDMDAGFPPAHEFLAHVYEAKGLPADAFFEYVRWRELSGDPPQRIAAFRAAYASSGLPGFDRTRLQFLLQDAAHTRVQPTEVAMLYARLGEKEQALAWLERAVEQHEGEVLWINALPDFDTIRADARFAGLVKRVNLAM